MENANHAFLDAVGKFVRKVRATVQSLSSASARCSRSTAALAAAGRPNAQFPLALARAVKYA
jgi:hypothetical protein